jgi:urease accessory protein
MGKTIRYSFLILLATLGLIEPALAHHPMGGQLPSTFAQGLLSGFGHPIIGLDHLAFVVGVGMAALLLKRRYLLPLAFVGATALGVVLHLSLVDLPVVEPVIAFSVLLIGLGLVRGKSLPVIAAAALFAIAGIFHGYAYGESIVGAEQTPLIAYFVGFCLIQYTIAIAAGHLVEALWKLGEEHALALRIGGGVVAGVGLVFVSEALMPF